MPTDAVAIGVAAHGRADAIHTPRLTGVDAKLGACQRHVRLLLVPRRDPRDPLHSQQRTERTLDWFACERGMEAFRMKGPLGAENEAGDAVLLRLWRVLVLACLLQPLRMHLRLDHFELGRTAEQPRRVKP
eukprot:6211294-Pleurochrysis_carterae.AAC.3